MEISNKRIRVDLKEAKENQLRFEHNRKELIASISHDLKTPLTSIKGYVTGNQDGVANTPEKLERYMETIDKKANDMDALIDELFLYSKLDLERVPFHFEKVYLYSFLTDYMEELEINLQKEKVEVEFVANIDDSYIVKADREQLNRVITNIIQNSLKYIDKMDKQLYVI